MGEHASDSVERYRKGMNGIMVEVRRNRDLMVIIIFFFQAEDGIRDLVRSRGLGDVYKRQI